MTHLESLLDVLNVLLGMNQTPFQTKNEEAIIKAIADAIHFYQITEEEFNKEGDKFPGISLSYSEFKSVA
jgi:hypothetical protein